MDEKKFLVCGKLYFLVEIRCGRKKGRLKFSYGNAQFVKAQSNLSWFDQNKKYNVRYLKHEKGKRKKYTTPYSNETHERHTNLGNSHCQSDCSCIKNNRIDTQKNETVSEFK